MRRRAGGAVGWGEVRVSLAEGRVRRGGRAGRRVPLGGAPRVGGSGVGRVPLGSLSRPGALVRIQNSNCPELGRHVGRAVGGWGGGGGGRWGRRITVPSGRRARRGGACHGGTRAALPLASCPCGERPGRRCAVVWRALRLARRAVQPAAPGQHRQRGGERLAPSPSFPPAPRWGRGRGTALLLLYQGFFFFLSGSGFPFWSLRWTVLRFLCQARCSFFF